MAGWRTEEARSGDSASSGRACLLRHVPTHRDEGDFGKWLSHSATCTAYGIAVLKPCEDFCFCLFSCLLSSMAKINRFPKRSSPTSFFDKTLSMTLSG